MLWHILVKYEEKMALIHHHEGTKAAESRGIMAHSDSGLVNKLVFLLAKNMRDQMKSKAKISQF